MAIDSGTIAATGDGSTAPSARLDGTHTGQVGAALSLCPIDCLAPAIVYASWPLSQLYGLLPIGGPYQCA